MRDITKERIVYKPFEYQEAHEYWMKQQQAHWLHTEVPMMADVNDWKQNLSKTEKNIIGSILKGFAQTETVVNDYWSSLVTKWFRKPEIIKMAVTFGAFETIHAEAYSLLNEECERKKISTLLTAHHFDDLHENFYLRIMRGSGLKGISSFGDIYSFRGELKILRPLITIKKSELISITRETLKFYKKRF